MGGGNVSQDQTSIICIDLKSFYASVECVERGLNPFKTNLVVADPTRSKSTICLAITPAMKSLGIKNRCRIHEIPDCVSKLSGPEGTPKGMYVQIGLSEQGKAGSLLDNPAKNNKRMNSC